MSGAYREYDFRHAFFLRGAFLLAVSIYTPNLNSIQMHVVAPIHIPTKKLYYRGPITKSFLCYLLVQLLGVAIVS